MTRTQPDDMNLSAFGKSYSGPLLTGATIGVAIALGGSNAWAQQSSSAAIDAPSRKENPTQLGKVSVQAEDDLEPSSTKFTAPLVDTPVSVTILPQSVMEDAAALSLQDALRNIPGITFAAGEGGTPTGDLPSIRGFNSASSTYVDGMRDIGLQTRDIFDLEQVEVIKGPDSTISGRAAGGGAINLVTKTARASNSLEVTGLYGTAGQWRSTLDGNLEVTESIAARLNFMDNRGGVPGRNSAVRTDKWGIAPTITFGLQSPTRLILSYYHFEDKSTPDYGAPADWLVTGQPLTQTQGINPENFYGLKDRDFRHNPVDSGTIRFEHDFGQAFNFHSQLRYTVSKNDYLVTLPYQATDADFNIQPGLIYRVPFTNDDRTRGLISQTELSGHFDTGLLRHDVDFGFEYSYEGERELGNGPYDGYNVVTSAGPQGFSVGGPGFTGDCTNAALLASYDCTNLFDPNPRDPWRGTITRNASESVNFTTHNIAPYAFDTITLSPHWKINAGLRWDRYTTGATDPVADAYNGGTEQESFLSYQIGVIYKPEENGSVYVTSSSASIPESQAYSGAQQDQSVNLANIPGITSLKPETTYSLEIGYKWNLFGNKLLLSGDIFQETHKNTVVDVTADTYAQIGETRVRGIEVSANGSISENWNVIGGYSHLSGDVLNGGLSYYEMGHHVPNTPPNTFSLWSTYRPIVPVTIGGGVYYVDKQIGYAGPPDEYVDSYWRVDAMAKWRIDPHVSVQVNVQNLFDKLYYAKTFYWYALPARGRTWLVTASVKL
jgi:catecholate siderophore receptor